MTQGWKDAVSDHMGGHDGKAPKKEIHEIRVRKGKSGGHVIEHHHTHPGHHPMEEHVTKTDDDMADHMLQNAGNPNPGEAAADAGTPDAAAAPAPTGSGAPAAAVPGM